MKKSVKFILMLLIILAAAGGGIYYVTMPTALRLTEIRPQLAELSFIEQGIVVAENAVLIFPVTQGELIGLYVEENQEVRAGDALASVDDTAIRLGIEQARSSINSLRFLIANLDTEQNRMRQEMQAGRNALLGELHAINAQAANSEFALLNQNEAIDEQIRIQNVLIKQIQADLERAREDFARADMLYRTGVLPLSDFEAAETALLHTETQLEVSRRELDVIAAGFGPSLEEYYEGMRLALNAQISGLDYQLGQDFTVSMAQHYQALIAAEEANIAQMEWELANSVITSPIDGVITVLHADGTNFLSPAAPVAEITVPGRLKIEVYVPVKDITNVNIGDRAELTLLQRENDIVFYGTISEISDRAVVHRSHLGVEERGVKVIITPDEPPISLGIGFEIDVKFFAYKEEDRFTVPLSAVFGEDGEHRVWVIRGGNVGKITSVTVELGRELRTETVITHGLFEGDFVVNDAGNKALREGARVRAE